jgi:hypothetical protein
MECDTFCELVVIEDPTTRVLGFPTSSVDGGEGWLPVLATHGRRIALKGGGGGKKNVLSCQELDLGCPPCRPLSPRRIPGTYFC